MLALLFIIGFSVVCIIVIIYAERIGAWLAASEGAWIAAREADSVGDTFPAEWCDHNHA